MCDSFLSALFWASPTRSFLMGCHDNLAPDVLTPAVCGVTNLQHYSLPSWSRWLSLEQQITKLFCVNQKLFLLMWLHMILCWFWSFSRRFVKIWKRWLSILALQNLHPSYLFCSLLNIILTSISVSGGNSGPQNLLLSLFTTQPEGQSV